MNKIKLSCQQRISKQKLVEILNEKYKISGYTSYLSNNKITDIYLKKNNWIGVAMELHHKNNSSYVLIASGSPSFINRLIL